MSDVNRATNEPEWTFIYKIMIVGCLGVGNVEPSIIFVDLLHSGIGQKFILVDIVIKLTILCAILDLLLDLFQAFPISEPAEESLDSNDTPDE